ncbi:MAG TPA: AbrB/MazE/SpoVT family DNA-binding domain-containing protein [Gammaproteobacteria bacterium]|nr:AbrB/MazE/SpoVT family DNA-binding domain-containing protein [Gammaproteobacteria bacterium]
METTRLSTKGQVVLPKTVRTALKLTAGTEFNVEQSDGAVLLRPVRLLKSTRVSDVVAASGYRGRRKTLAEQNAAIKTRTRGRK